MPGIFISYRRVDSQHFSGRLFDRLADRYGRDRVFRDVDAIPPGEEFSKVIDRCMETSGAVIVVIGRQWLDARNEKGVRRLDDPDDPVRQEVATALKQRKHLIPLLVEATPMPRPEALPHDISALTNYNALPFLDAHFDASFQALVAVVDKALPDCKQLSGRRSLVRVARWSFASALVS